MQVSCYLIIQGVKPKFGSNRETRREPGSIQVRKNKPSLSSDEIAVRLDLEVPDSLFYKPTLEVKASIPEGIPSGPVVSAEVMDNIAEIVRGQTGLEVRISAVGEDDNA